MSDELKDFKRFMQQREAAARDYVCGDASALDAMATHEGDATFFGPHGGALHGARAVAGRYIESRTRPTSSQAARRTSRCCSWARAQDSATGWASSTRWRV